MRNLILALVGSCWSGLLEDVTAPTPRLGDRVEFGLSLDGRGPTSDVRHQSRRCSARSRNELVMQSDVHADIITHRGRTDG